MGSCCDICPPHLLGGSCRGTCGGGLGAQGGREAGVGLPKNLLGGGVGPWSPFPSPPPPLGAPRDSSLFPMLFMHLHTPPPQSKRPPCNKSKTPKASVFTEEPHRITTFRQNFPAHSRISGDWNGVCVCVCVCVPCEHAPPPPLQIVGGKISGICIEEISLWPLEPLSAPPSPQICGGSKLPPPPEVKFSPPLGVRGEYLWRRAQGALVRSGHAPPRRAASRPRC